MSERDDLADIMWDEDASDWRSGPNELADAILAAGYRKHRTITTVEELDALPKGSVVLSESYTHFETGMRISFQRWDEGLWHRGGRSASTDPDNFLPATVLYEPPARPV